MAQCEVSPGHFIYSGLTIGFLIRVETKIFEEQVEQGHVETRVSTNYVVESNIFLRPFHFLVRIALRRNYQILMSEDLPMRERRGLLRRRGFLFRKDGAYGYETSKN